MMLEDSTFNFLHGCWNYCFIKTDIDVMILFKFDIKCVKLNFKAIASMEFCFDLKINLLCSYDGSLFMKNHWKLLDENSGKLSFTSFDRLRIPFDRSNVPFRSIEQESRIDRVNPRVYAEFIKILTNWEFLSINRIFLLIDLTGIENRSSHPDCLLKFSSWFWLIKGHIRSIESCEFWIFTKAAFGSM